MPMTQILHSDELLSNKIPARLTMRRSLYYLVGLLLPPGACLPIACAMFKVGLAAGWTGLLCQPRHPDCVVLWGTVETQSFEGEEVPAQQLPTPIISRCPLRAGRTGLHHAARRINDKMCDDGFEKL